MVISDEKFDDLMESVHHMMIDLGVLKTRVDHIDLTLQDRAGALCNIYNYMQKTDERLLKLETNKEDEAIMRSWFAPYALAVFSSVVSYLVFHFVGR